jgi:hypothetical protein
VDRQWDEAAQTLCCASDTRHRHHLAVLYRVGGACEACGAPQSGVLDVEGREYAYCACGTFWLMGVNTPPEGTEARMGGEHAEARHDAAGR